MTPLPPEVLDRIDEVLTLADLDAGAAREVRADLERHFEDGLRAGRTPDELLERFGSARAMARSLRRGPAPTSRTLPAGDGALSSLARTVRLGARSLARRPALSLAAITVLALGVGSNTVVFTVLNALLLRPLPVHEPETLVDVWADVRGGNSFEGFAYADFLEYREAEAGLERLAAFTGRRLRFGDGEVRIVGQLVSDAYFPMLGLQPSLGTLSFPDPDFGTELTVVLSHAFWSGSFGSDAGVIGRDIRLDGHPARVVGVGPPGFTGHFIGFPSDVWLPITAADPLIDGFDPSARSSMPFEMIGRRTQGATPASVAQALNTVAARIEGEHPDVKRGHRVGVTPTTGLDHSLHRPVVAFVAVLVTVAALVLLIACLNVGSLLLVRAMAREREIAVRLALGAGTGRLVRQLLTEAVLLVGAGAALGSLLAVQATGALERVVDALAAGIRVDLTTDVRVLGLTVGAASVAAVLASLAPALHLLRRDPAGSLRTRGDGGGGGVRLRSVLVVGQVAASVILLAMTGLLVRGLLAARGAPTGFEVEGLSTFVLSLDPNRLAEGSGPVIRGQVQEAVAAIPGVESAAWSDGAVLGVARSPLALEVPGVQPPPGLDAWTVDGRIVGPGYFETVGIPVLAGRSFNREDDDGGPPVAVVSRAFAQRFWPGRPAVGRTLRIGAADVQVVGVAADARYLAQDPSPDPLVYLSRAGRFLPRVEVAVRSAGTPGLSAGARAVVEALVPDHPPLVLGTPRQTLDDALFPQRMGSLIVGVMGLCALVLATVGLYGLIQFTVARDTHELGVRLALGGSPGHLMAVVLRKGVVLVAWGVGLGVAAALLAAPGLGALLGGVSPADPITFGLVVASFALVALLASGIPALRAQRIAPTEALRQE